jgi:hypothetical protein
MARRESLSDMLARRSGTGGRRAQRLTLDMLQATQGPAETAPLTRNVYPPWVYKLPISADFNRNTFSSVLGAGAGSVIVPVTFTLPDQQVGWLQIFGIYVLTPTALTDITFTLRVNGGPVEGWDNINIPPGVANSFTQNFGDLQVRVPNSGHVDVVVTNNNASGPWTVGSKIAGWYHPESEEQRIYGDI